MDDLIAGIDFGTRRIGIALANVSVGIATPYATYQVRSEKLDRQYFVELVADEQVARFVVGLPVHLSGRESEKSQEARAFGKWLGEATGVPVEYFDERFTTLEAERVLQQANLTKAKRVERRDQLAAQIMLTAYLESGADGDPSPGAIDD